VPLTYSTHVQAAIGIVNYIYTIIKDEAIVMVSHKNSLLVLAIITT